MLLSGLPPDSLWWTVLRRRGDVTPAGDIDGIRWGTIHDLLAALIDATYDVGWVLRQTHSKGKVPPPKPFRRPGTGRRRTGMSRRNRDRVAGWITASRTRGDEHGV